MPDEEPVDTAGPLADYGTPQSSTEEATRSAFFFGLLIGGGASFLVAILLLHVAEQHRDLALGVAWVLYVGLVLAAALLSVVTENRLGGLADDLHDLDGTQA